jgi:hypothetical protein
VSFCDIFDIDEAKLSYEYLAFASQKKLMGKSPTMAIIEAFEKELSKTLASSKATKATLESVTSAAVYDSSTLPLGDASMADADLVHILPKVFFKLPPYTQAGLDLMTHSSSLHRWQAETIPLTKLY